MKVISALQYIQWSSEGTIQQFLICSLTVVSTRVSKYETCCTEKHAHTKREEGEGERNLSFLTKSSK